MMETICPPGYHYNGFVTTNALEHLAGTKESKEQKSDQQPRQGA